MSGPPKRARGASVVDRAPAPDRNAAGGNWFAVRRDGIAGLRPMSLKNHLKREAPQHATAARVASVRQNFFRLLSPSTLQDLRACNALVFTLGSLAPRPLDPFFASIATFKNAPPRTIRAHAARHGQSDSRRDATLRNHSALLCTKLPMSPLARWVPMGWPPPQPSHKRSAPGLPFRRFGFSTFSAKTTQNAHHPNTCPPQELRTKKIACVTLCHLGILPSPRHPQGVALRIGGWDAYVTHEEWHYGLAGRMPTLPRKFASGIPALPGRDRARGCVC